MLALFAVKLINILDLALGLEANTGMMKPGFAAVTRYPEVEQVTRPSILTRRTGII